MNLKSIIPLINHADFNTVVLEWWNDSKKLTLYINDEEIEYYKVIDGIVIEQKSVYSPLDVIKLLTWTFQ